jgi:preprotein translocase subunit Sss1
MSGLGAVVIVVIAVALLVAAVLLVRSRRVTPWPAIVVAMFASAVCFTVGGDTSRDASQPSVATVIGAGVGILSVAAAILAMIRRPEGSPLTRVPTMIAAAAIVIGAVGLIVNLLTS